MNDDGEISSTEIAAGTGQGLAKTTVCGRVIHRLSHLRVLDGWVRGWML